MNIIDAVKSGRPFRRKKDISYVVFDHEHDAYIDMAYSFALQTSPGIGRRLTWDDILADDWEIQEPSVTITASEFKHAFTMAWNDTEDPENESGLCWLLLRRLGLEPKP